MKKTETKRAKTLYLATDDVLVRLFISVAEEGEARRSIAELGLTPLRSDQRDLQALAKRGAVVEDLRQRLEQKWKEEDEMAEGDE